MAKSTHESLYYKRLTIVKAAYAALSSRASRGPLTSADYDAVYNALQLATRIEAVEYIHAFNALLWRSAPRSDAGTIARSASQIGTGRKSPAYIKAEALFRSVL